MILWRSISSTSVSHGVFPSVRSLRHSARGTDGATVMIVGRPSSKANWALCFTEAEKFCSHGKNCKHGNSCTVGRRIEYKHLLTGAVLPFWNQIQSAVGYKDVAHNGGYRQQSNMQIVRLRVDKTPQQAEQRLVGVLIDDRQLAALQRSIDDDGADGAAHAAAHACE